MPVCARLWRLLLSQKRLPAAVRLVADSVRAVREFDPRTAALLAALEGRDTTPCASLWLRLFTDDDFLAALVKEGMELMKEAEAT